MLVLESLFPFILLSLSSPIETRVHNRTFNIVERVTAAVLTTLFISSFSSNLFLVAQQVITLSRRLTVYIEKRERERGKKHVESVAVAPQIAPFAIAEEPANWGDSISVVCAILKGDLPIEITWALNGEPIRPDRSDINILATTRKNSILSIESVAARHAGEYTCSASNKAGATSYSATLAVNGTSCLRDSLRIYPPYPIIVYYPLLSSPPPFSL